MKSKSRGILAVALGLLFAAMPALAHHSAAVQYDENKRSRSRERSSRWNGRIRTTGTTWM